MYTKINQTSYHRLTINVIMSQNGNGTRNFVKLKHSQKICEKEEKHIHENKE